MNLVLILLISIPLVEIYLFIKVGAYIGAFNTISLILFTAIIGVIYARYEGFNSLKSGVSQLIKNQLPIWLEGDEVFVCDGEMRIHGTGTEDYFNCGWYGVSGRLYNPENYPLHGFPQYEMNEIDKAGTAAAYRWHFLEPIPFTKDIHVTVEHGINNGVEVNYKSIAFYYLKRI